MIRGSDEVTQRSMVTGETAQALGKCASNNWCYSSWKMHISVLQHIDSWRKTARFCHAQPVHTLTCMGIPPPLNMSY